MRRRRDRSHRAPLAVVNSCRERRLQRRTRLFSAPGARLSLRYRDYRPPKLFLFSPRQQRQRLLHHEPPGSAMRSARAVCHALRHSSWKRNVRSAMSSSYSIYSAVMTSSHASHGRLVPLPTKHFSGGSSGSGRMPARILSRMLAATSTAIACSITTIRETADHTPGAREPIITQSIGCALPPQWALFRSVVS
jgi:hypothetical protein